MKRLRKGTRGYGTVLPGFYLKGDRHQAWHRGTYSENVYSKGHEELGAKNRTQAVIQWMEINEREY